MKKVLVLGSLNMDLVTNVKVTPKVGETILGRGFSEIPGGKGANQAVAMGRLGGQVSMLGRVGDDNFGTDLLEALTKSGVKSDNVKKVSGSPTGTALIMVNDDGDNSIVVIPGANFKLTPDCIESKEVDKALKEADYLVAQLETPMETIELAFDKAKKMGLKTVLNPAPAQALSKSLISNVDLLIPNETEFELLTGHSAETKEGLQAGADLLFDQGISALIITLGKKGALYIDKDHKNFHVSGYEVEAVDTTAAGDSFIGGLVTALSEGASMEDAMAFAMKVGAVTVTKHGAQSSLPSRKEIESFKGVKRK